MLTGRSLSIVFIIILISISSAFAQKKKKEAAASTCPVQQAPSVRGFRLGMPLIEVKDALEDKSLFDAKISEKSTVGSRGVRLLGSELKGDNAEGVDDVDLVFVDDRLSYVKVNFNSAMHWDSATDFFLRMSETLGLPKPKTDETGGVSNQRNQKYTFECTNFSVILAYSFGVTPSVALSDTLAQKTVGERNEKEEGKKVRSINIGPGGPPPPTTRQPPR